MHSNTSNFSARRDRRAADRRTRRRPAILASGLAFGLITATAFTAAIPAAQADTVASAPSVAAPTYTLASDTTPLTSATIVAAAPKQDVASEADQAVAAATAVIASAGSVTSDIASSGLDVGDPDPTVDTAELQDAVEQLQAADTLPAPLVPDIADDVTELASTVDVRVNQLRGSLDGAIALKAEQEAAAEAARVAAEEAAAAKAAAEKARAAAPAPVSQARSTSSAPAPAPAPVATGGGSGDNSPGGAQAAARGMLGSYGWGDDQFGCLQSLWQKESGWNYKASNRSSGAYGIPQALPGSKMASAGADWATNAGTQIAWGFGYISSRYGSPCGAWSHSQSVGWY
ncbi:lytic transglycosylase domain-containing protein [Microbacterium sp. P04]|uniref:aggregation-promoting factor C-terminal-like domain-containing protein n=1 Tax=Microbacterium sp. P04 TaxID=3366947 RepID=UPI003745AFE1